MSLSKEERNAIVAYRMEKAMHTLKEALGISSLGYWNAGKTVTFHDPAVICSIYCSQDSMKLDEALDTSAQAGFVYNTEITGFVPGDTEYAREQFSLMADCDFIVICVDANENYRIAGDFLTPLLFSSRFTTGRNSVDRAGHEISFAGKTFEKAMAIDNPF